MTNRTYAIIRTLETRIAIADNNDQNTLLVTVDVLKEILGALKDSESIVRCKDCDYSIPMGKSINTGKPLFYCGSIDSGCSFHDCDHYCADGKRK